MFIGRHCLLLFDADHFYSNCIWCRVSEEIIIIGVYWRPQILVGVPQIFVGDPNFFMETPINSLNTAGSRWRPPDFHLRPHNFVAMRTPRFSLETQDFCWRPPYFHWRPHIIVGCPHIFKGDPRILLETSIFLLETSISSLDIPKICNGNPTRL